MMRLKLSVTYINGAQLSWLVHYVHVEYGSLYFAVDQQITSAGMAPVKISLKNIESYDIKMVDCDGWKEKEATL